MTSRFLVAAVVAAVVVGLASDARAQKRAGVLRNSRKAKVAAAPQAPASAVTEAATTSPDVAAPADPFDSLAGKAEKTEGKAGEAAGKLDSPGEGEKAGLSPGKTERATFGAGCFWPVESGFEWLPGVQSAVSGYAGGSVPHPAYEEVHEGVTGHAEVVQVEYDPAVITYEQLLKVFWTHHDPTQLNRQGPDVGTQYRSVILYHNEAQRRAALKSYRELTAARVFRGPIVTQLVPMRVFYRAEDYHQNYYGGKDDQRVARTTRSRRPAKSAAKSKSAVALKPQAAKPAAESTKRSADGQGSSTSVSPGRGGEVEP